MGGNYWCRRLRQARDTPALRGRAARDIPFLEQPWESPGPMSAMGHAHLASFHPQLQGRQHSGARTPGGAFSPLHEPPRLRWHPLDVPALSICPPLLVSLWGCPGPTCSTAAFSEPQISPTPSSTEVPGAQSSLPQTGLSRVHLCTSCTKRQAFSTGQTPLGSCWSPRRTAVQGGHRGAKKESASLAGFARQLTPI